MNWKRFTLPTFCFALALAGSAALRAQETPPTPTVEPAKPAEAPAAPEAVAPITPLAPIEAPAVPAEPAPEVATTAPEAAKPDSAASAVSAPEGSEEAMRELGTEEPAAPAKPKKRAKRQSSAGEDVPPHFGSQTITTGQKQAAAISISGNTVVDGDIEGEAVSVFGNTTVNGLVGGEAVSVFGTTTINGHVKGEAVAVFGDVVLGPDAVVDGQVVAVLGAVKRSPGAKVGGGVQQIGGAAFDFGGFVWLQTYFKKCLIWGRPLAFGENLGWAWMFAGVLLAFYMMLALIFPRGIERCAEVLEQRPGNTILAALLAALLSPIVFVLLAITGIGLVLVPFLAAGLFFGSLFGKAAVLGWMGRRVTGLLGDNFPKHAVLTVLIGGLIVALLYTVPFLGFLLWKLFSVLGVGMVVYVLILSMQREKPATPAAAAPQARPVAPVSASFTAQAFPAADAGGSASAGFAAAAATGAMPAQSSGFGAAASGPVPVEPPPAASFGAGSPFTVPAAPAPLFSAETLPRAGFWIRVGAAFLDFLLLVVPLGILGLFDHGPGLMFLSISAYHVVMWKMKGTTIGGIICGLKLVRIDDRPMDWGVAVVRALTAFLSLFAFGLGFIWVVFDDQKQSWHDKVAGTTLVRVPKGVPLL